MSRGSSDTCGSDGGGGSEGVCEVKHGVCWLACMDDQQGPRIVWRLGWGVENSDSKCAVRVENSVLK